MGKREGVARHADLILRNNRRGHPTSDQLVFREKMPLALKNHVKSTSQKSNQKVCMEEMMGLIDCMNKYQQDKSMCNKEVLA